MTFPTPNDPELRLYCNVQPYKNAYEGIRLGWLAVRNGRNHRKEHIMHIGYVHHLRNALHRAMGWTSPETRIQQIEQPTIKTDPWLLYTRSLRRGEFAGRNEAGEKKKMYFPKKLKKAFACLVTCWNIKYKFEEKSAPNLLKGVSQAQSVGTAILRFRKTNFGRRKMKDSKPTDQQILNAKIASWEERWSPGRDNLAIGMDEGILRALAKFDESARRVVQLADNWKGTEVPGNRLNDFFCELISGKTVKNLDSKKIGPDGKRPVGAKKTAYEKWPLAAWFYLRYFCKKEHRGKTLLQISLEENMFPK